MNETKNGSYQKKNIFDVTTNALNSTLEKYDQFSSKLHNKTIFLGFDGYIDSLYSMVSERTNSEKWIKMELMNEFGERILAASGSSCNIERVLKKRIAGGFAPNMARAISNLGSKVYLSGAFGFPNIDPLFKEFPNNVELFSIKDMGETAAFEFNDGKVMCTDFGNINSITWETIMNRIPRDDFIQLIENSDAIGQGHWSLMPNMNSYWTHMIDEIFPNIKNMKNKIFMVDPADFKKRTPEDINKMLKLLQKLEEISNVMLSLNDKEAEDISQLLSSNKSDFDVKLNDGIKKHEDFTEIGKSLNDILGYSFLVIHDPHFATITNKSDHYWVTEGYTSKPNYTTAAGDHFNGGVLLGLSSHLNPEEALIIGNSLTAVFVRTGISVNSNTLLRFVSNYMQYISQDSNNFEMK